MNSDNVYDLLLERLEGFLYHKSLLSDISAIISRSGNELAFFRLLTARLISLAQLGKKAVLLKEFEELRYADGLCSLHIAGKDMNIRILYYYREDSAPVLLSAFTEKAGKRITDYSSHTPVANERKAEMEAKNDNE